MRHHTKKAAVAGGTSHAAAPVREAGRSYREVVKSLTGDREVIEAVERAERTVQKESAEKDST